MSLPISTSYSDIMRCRQAWWGVSGTLNCVLFFTFLCFHPQPWKYGILSSNRAQILLYLTLSNLLNFIVFVCSSENKRDNADASIEWRLISFWSAEINRWKALSGNFFFLRGIYRCGWIKENLLNWTTVARLWLRVGEEILLLSKNPKFSPQIAMGKIVSLWVLKGKKLCKVKEQE